MNKKNNINKEILLVLLGMIIVTLILLCVRYYKKDKVISDNIRKNEIKTEQNERLEGDILKYANIFNEKSKVKKKEEKIYIVYFDETKEYFIKTVEELRKNTGTEKISEAIISILKKMKDE